VKRLALTIAGITVGFVVVPQGMAYALLAQLGPEYGLYTSFVGFLLYWAFATSKDITIGVSASHERDPCPPLSDTS
jgi:sodium-independent sulfate anion transporter 11